MSDLFLSLKQYIFRFYLVLEINDNQNQVADSSSLTH